MFLGGNHKFRPFEDAILDGIDLDIENGLPQYYNVFLDTLREYYSNQSKKYYISAAPQCVFPDKNLELVLDSSWS